MSRSEYLSTMPPSRRWLARLNWHPVYEIEQETECLRMIENACLVAQCRFLLSGTTRHRLHLNQALALLIEEFNS